MLRKIALLAALAGLIAACDSLPSQSRRDLAGANRDYEATLQEALLDAEPGDVIEIPEGVFVFTRPLSLSVDNVTIRGQGAEKTILSFQEQKAGAEGLLVTADGFTLENLAIEDTIGDGLKVNEGDGVTIRGVRVEWTNGPATENGAYGLYPVQCKNVLIENSIAIGASDAGIYVGQSDGVVVRNSRAEWNVAGIEIENTANADVYGNVAVNNTGGILVFDMPNLPVHGSKTRVYQNDVHGNNTKNFGREGTAVASVPAGTGIIVNSGDEIEIFANNVEDHRTANVIISSLYSANYSELSQTEAFDPYPEDIHIHNNVFGKGGYRPDGFDLRLLRLVKLGIWGTIPDVLWDGYAPEEGVRICVDNGDAQVMNADGPNGYKNPHIATEGHDCTLDPLPPVTISQLSE